MTGYLRMISNSETETIELGVQIASRIPDDIVILLSGPLGVGKSVLVRGIAKGVGYYGRVKSPSFTIERVYETPRGEFHHWDLYRFENSDEIEPVFDQIRSQDGIRVVEWGERLETFVRFQYPFVKMDFTDHHDKRELSIDNRLLTDLNK